MSNPNNAQLYCRRPFESLEVTSGGAVRFCCWADTFVVGDLSKQSLSEIWNGAKIEAFRNSMFDGTYRYCDKSRCPYLSGRNRLRDEILIDITRPAEQLEPLLSKEVLTALENRQTALSYRPKTMTLSYDQTCNLSCPSCRPHVVNENARKDHFQKISNQLKPFGEHLTLSGAGDPFYSAHFLDLLFNSTAEDLKYVNLITIMTNGLLLTPKLWSRVSSAIKRKIILLEVSIDAANEETFHINRRGGDWRTLLENLEFIADCQDFQEIGLSFVIQNNNFRQMKDFVRFAKRYKANVIFRKLSNWGTFDQEEFRKRNVFSKAHPSHDEFLKVLSDPVFGKKHIEMPPLEFEGPETQTLVRPGLGYSFFSIGSHERFVSGSNGTHLYSFNNTEFETDYFECGTGSFSRKVVGGSSGYMGFGFFHDQPYDVSQFHEMSLILKAGNFRVDELYVFLKDQTREARLRPVDFGFLRDGQFHEVKIPIAAFADKGIDLKNLTSSFGLIAEKTHVGDYLFINDLSLN